MNGKTNNNKKSFFFFFFFYVIDKKRCGSVVQKYKEANLRDEKIFKGKSREEVGLV
jgi:hypothetical protein